MAPWESLYYQERRERWIFFAIGLISGMILGACGMVWLYGNV